MKSDFFKMKFTSFGQLRVLLQEKELCKYHSRIGFPKSVKLPCGLISFKFTNHSIVAMQSDQYSSEKLIVNPYLNVSYSEIIEIVLYKNEIIKFACRTDYNSTYDITLVIAVKPFQVYNLCTCWLNKKSDHHSTLRKERYDICK
jgi:hypothetical protein